MAESELNPHPDSLSLLRHDISEKLVDAVLDSQRQQELFFRRGIAGWEALKSRPNLQHYIAVTSFEAAPDDPVLREQVTCVLVGMISMLDTAFADEHAASSNNLEELIKIVPVQRQLAPGGPEAA